MKTPDYLDYSRYKKKKKDSSKNAVLIFFTTFFAMLLIFTVIVKSLSPDVDVTIGGDSETDAKESGLGVKKFIDERLKLIQMEDDSAGVSQKLGDSGKPSSGYDDKSFDNFSKQMEEKVVLPSQKTPSETVDEENQDVEISTPPRPTGRDISSSSEVAPKMSKVFVGRYSSLEQAKVAQGIMQDSGLNITPFIKDLGGSYTLQVGSYSSREKANSLASELLRNNFPARVVQE